jgi:3-hydroxymyristoyl/3-hydroxydecanoyl-(acyl carrier protein) dehydratase
MTDLRLKAFSFVDRITSRDQSGEVLGDFLIPQHAKHFPHALVAEAIGQLAAWHSMACLDFQYRPVAALAGDTRFFTQPQPGDVLQLRVGVESFDEDSISYHGTAYSSGQPVLALDHYSGAMLPQQDFDDPRRVAEDFATLISTGAKPARMASVPHVLADQPTLHQNGCITSGLNVPLEADFFGDHFPRKPVFPATLLMHALSSMLLQGLASIPALKPAQPTGLRALRRVKMRSWIHPGDQVLLQAEGYDPKNPCSRVRLSAFLDNKLVASAVAEIGHDP